MRCRRFVPFAAVALFTVQPALAQEIKVGGQIRPRWEYRDPNLADLPDGKKDNFVSMRSRLHVTASFEDWVKIFVQVQDVRLWGEEGSTLGDYKADNFDLHQGYVELGDVFETALWARVGRQEVNLGGQRLIGSVNWAQQARSFDGVRVGAAGKTGRLDLLGSVISDRSAPDREDNSGLAALYGVLNLFEGNTLDAYAIYDGIDKEEPDTDTNRGTLGARWVGKHSIFTYRAEGSYQLGKLAGTDISAFMFGARLAAGFGGGKGTVTLWYDYLSGDDGGDEEKVKVFDTLFATNHKFYGYADLFLNIPAHTNGQGLQDLALKGLWRPHQDWRLILDLHAFFLAQKRNLETSTLGQEIDIVADWKFHSNVSLLGGFSYVIVGDGLTTEKGIGRLDRDMPFVFVQLNATF
jgi:hypothetical protein